MKHEPKEVEKEESESSEGMASPSGDKDWKVECAAQDLLRAEKVKQDPELYKKAQEYLVKEKKAIDAVTSIDDIKKIRNDKAKEA